MKPAALVTPDGRYIVVPVACGGGAIPIFLPRWINAFSTC